MAERILPAIAAEHVPALADQRDQQRTTMKLSTTFDVVSSGTVRAARRRAAMSA
jgi:hypothetical protein